MVLPVATGVKFDPETNEAIGAQPIPMKNDLIPLITCSWCAVIMGVLVTATAYPTPAFFGSALCTALAVVIAVSVTSEFRGS